MSCHSAKRETSIGCKKWKKLMKKRNLDEIDTKKKNSEVKKQELARKIS
jgi:hypothetical protein